MVELIHQVDADFIICTEVGEQGHRHQIPDFNMFFEKGTNMSGGVIIYVAKHLKASKVETNMANTLIIDVIGLNEPLRVIEIYWPESHKRDINEITPFIINNTVISGDFNAAVIQWNSPKTDSRSEVVKTWNEVNNLQYVRGTVNSSKRSDRNIDLIFSNYEGIKRETLKFGSSDHWPLVYRSELIIFDKINHFPVVQWKAYEIVLYLLQEFWAKLLEYAPPLE